MRHIQPHHSELAARTQHGIGRLGVARHVGLGTGAHVSGHGKRTAHHDHATDRHHLRRIALQGKRQIGERAGRNVDQIGTIGTRGINQAPPMPFLPWISVVDAGGV